MTRLEGPDGGGLDWDAKSGCEASLITNGGITCRSLRGPDGAPGTIGGSTRIGMCQWSKRGRYHHHTFGREHTIFAPTPASLTTFRCLWYTWDLNCRLYSDRVPFLSEFSTLRRKRCTFSFYRNKSGSKKWSERRAWCSSGYPRRKSERRNVRTSSDIRYATSAHVMSHAL
jgi:hypothetical protein